MTKVQAQTPIVAYNMLEAVKAKEIGGKPKVKEYKGFMELIGVSMGPVSYSSGIFYLMSSLD